MDLAGEIKRRNESYIIVERDGNCERCKVFNAKAILKDGLNGKVAA